MKISIEIEVEDGVSREDIEFFQELVNKLIQEELNDRTAVALNRKRINYLHRYYLPRYDDCNIKLLRDSIRFFIICRNVMLNTQDYRDWREKREYRMRRCQYIQG